MVKRDIPFLTKSIGGIKGRITYFKNQLDSNPNLNLGELKSILNRLKSLYSRFDETQTELEVLSPELDDNARNEFDDAYGEVESTLINLIDELENKSIEHSSIEFKNKSTAIGMSTTIPFPEMKIPEFDGNFLSWSNFRDIFKELIHDNKTLSSVIKFHYLREGLSKGRAFHFIEDLPATTENYEQVWSSLFKYYENETRVKFLVMKEIYNLKAVRQENNARALQIFIDSFWKHYNALKALKIPVEHWDLYLIYHVCELLDPISRQQVEIKKPSDKMMTINDVMDILSKCASVLEAMSMSNTAIPNTKSKSDLASSTTSSNSKQGSDKSSRTLVATDTNISCFYCKSSHSIFKCKTFEKLSVSERNDWVTKQNICRNCLYNHPTSSCKMRGCRICKRMHHTLLHRNKGDWDTPQSSSGTIQTLNESESKNSSPLSTPISNNQNNGTSNKFISQPCSSSASSAKSSDAPKSSSMCVANQIDELLNSDSINNSCFHSANQILLATAVIWVQGPTGIRYKCRVLLDSGSQSNFITENLCQLLMANKQSIYLPVTGISERVTHIKHQVNLKIMSRTTDFESTLNFLVLPKITGDLPLYPIKFDINSLPKQFILGDPHFYAPQKIDMLLGAEIYLNLMIGEMTYVVDELPPFQNTVFGHVVFGKVNASVSESVVSLHCCNIDLLKQDIQRFWQIEEVNVKNNYSIEEKVAEEHYVKNVKRDSSGRYSVALPFKNNIGQLGESYRNTLSQFYYLEKKLMRNLELKQRYTEFINEYIALNHMECVDTKNSNDTTDSFYMPHHGVFKESSSSTKLRVVFNASSKTSSGISLNDCLLVGPTIQQDLLYILIRFRKFLIALSADITKMYRQIDVRESDRSFQKILWRESSDVPKRTYQLNTVTYGTASAPFTAIRTLKQLALDECKHFPNESQLLLKHFYVDDFLSGANSIQEAHTIRENLTSLLSKGGFELRKWSSNCKEVVLDNENPNSNVVSTLGTTWDAEKDTFRILLNKFNSSPSVMTKRSVLSQIAQLFDPLALCAPVVFSAKVFMQKLWSYPEIKWDDPLTDSLQQEWPSFLAELEELKFIETPRCVCPFENPITVELHGFGDASEKGFGCCVFIRSIGSNGEIKCRLLCAKSKLLW